MAEQDQNPEQNSAAGEGADSQDPIQDPLAQAEEILRDLPVEDAEDSEAGDPVSMADAAGTPAPEVDGEILEEPELSETPEGESLGGEIESEEAADVAEQVLGAEGDEADARIAEAGEAEIGDIEPGEAGFGGLDAEAPEAEIPDPSQREGELQADLQRLQAEYVNYRRRVERDRSLERERTVGQVITSLTPVLDDIHAARQAGDLADGPFAAIAAKLETLLEQQGLQRIDEEGVPFDPSVHEALMQQPHAEIPVDHVGAVLRAGYVHGDRVLRAAQVMVSTGQPD